MVGAIGERQTIWGWKVALYLFLAGLGAGSYVLGVAAQFVGAEWDVVAKAGVTLGGPTVALSSLFLLWDLGHPLRFSRAGLRPRTSWISRGVYILSLFILVSLVHLPLVWLEASLTVQKVLGVIGGLLAVLTMVYTGLLLGAVQTIRLWSSPALPLLFLVSALSTGFMAVSLVLAVYMVVTGDAAAGEASILRTDTALIALEAVVVFCYLYLVRSTLAGKASADALVRGDLAPLFWGGFIVLGLVIPFVLELVLLGPLGDASGTARLAAAAAAVGPGLLGGYVLRHLVVAGGVKGPLIVFGRAVAVPARPRFVPPRRSG